MCVCVERRATFVYCVLMCECPRLILSRFPPDSKRNHIAPPRTDDKGGTQERVCTLAHNNTPHKHTHTHTAAYTLARSHSPHKNTAHAQEEPRGNSSMTINYAGAKLFINQCTKLNFFKYIFNILLPTEKNNVEDMFSTFLASSKDVSIISNAH